ncbi:twin-arginine translocation signal domain-containing protein [Stenotrophomonas ginsengisoli]|uniref:twin-arginine translocation signal domain-containing protein n=1 Tax=Stenotrophomonas ginsengisoli TaxID=336566 RepID=UPI00128F0993
MSRRDFHERAATSAAGSLTGAASWPRSARKTQATSTCPCQPKLAWERPLAWLARYLR